MLSPADTILGKLAKTIGNESTSQGQTAVGLCGVSISGHVAVGRGLAGSGCGIGPVTSGGRELACKATARGGPGRERICRNHKLAGFLLACALLGGLPHAGAATKVHAVEGAGAGLRTITTAREAHGLSSQEAARGYPVHLRAVVTFFDPYVSPTRTGLFVHDATGSIFVNLAPNGHQSLPPGSLVDVRGVSDPGEFAPIVAQPQVKVIGYAGLPSNAARPSFRRLFSGAEDGQWVEVEGVVHSLAENDRSVSLQLTMADGVIGVFVLKEPGQSYSRLVDARIRVRGNAAPLFDKSRTQMIGARISCANLSAVEILEPAPKDPFQLATIPVYRLLEWSVAPLREHRVHVRGRVTLQWPGAVVCLRDGQQGICAETNQSTRLADGEMVDVVGFAKAEGSAPALTDAVFRSAGSEKAVPEPPVTVTPEQALLGEHESHLIQVEAQLLSRDFASADTKLVLNSGRLIFSAILPHGLGGQEATGWKNGSILRITGICSVQLDAARTSSDSLGAAVPTTLRILMRSPADVVVIKDASWWTPVHGALLLGLALCGTLTVLAWVVLLRKRIHESEERFRHLAQHDTLTGLATRLVLEDRLNLALETARRHETTLGMLMLDVDNFKQINDKHGHRAGDVVLRVMASRIVEIVRKSDTVARMGGDEFVVLLPDMKDPENAEGIAKKLVAALSAPVSFQSREVPVSVSVGVCTVAGDELDGDALLTHVDAAMYEAKEHGRNRYQVYRPEFVQARA